MIFNDRTLREIARARPRDVAALVAVHGVGPAKVESYGEMVLALVREFEK